MTEGVLLIPSISVLKARRVRRTPCDDPGAPQTQYNYDHDDCWLCGAPGSMCWVKTYLGVEIVRSSESTSRTVTAFFFEENGMIYVSKLCLDEIILYSQDIKLDNSSNTSELNSRDWLLILSIGFQFFSIFGNILPDFLKNPPRWEGKILVQMRNEDQTNYCHVVVWAKVQNRLILNNAWCDFFPVDNTLRTTGEKGAGIKEKKRNTYRWY